MSKNIFAEQIKNVLPKVNNIKLNKQAILLLEDLKANSIFIGSLSDFYKDCGSVYSIHEIEIKVNNIVLDYYTKNLNSVYWSLIIGDNTFDFIWQGFSSEDKFTITNLNILKGLDNVYEYKGYKLEKFNYQGVI